MLVRFCWNLTFMGGFSKNTQILNFMKILPLGAELFNADGRTEDRLDGTTSRFSPFSARAYNQL